MIESKEFSFSSKKYADVGLPMRKEGNFSFGLSSFGAGKRFGDNSPKAFMFVGNLKGIFGEVLNGELRPDLSNEQTFGKNFSEWLVKEVSLGSVFYVVGTNSLIDEYFKPVFNKVDEWLCKRCKFRAYPIERFAKLKKLSLKSEKDYGLIYIEIIKWLMNEKVEFDYILMNPPYNVGNSITRFAIIPTDNVKESIVDENGKEIDKELSSRQTLLSSGKCVCLMPLGQYKSNGLYKHVEDFRLADPEMFEDASITNNLCICTLRKSVVDRFKTYEELSMESYDPKFKAFYEYNKVHKVLEMKFHPTKSYLEYLNKNHNRIFINSVRIAVGGYAKLGLSKDWYDGKTELPIDNEGSIQIFAVEHKNVKANDNYATFVFNSGFLNDAIKGLNKTNGTVSIAIPQIDWETVSETPLWKEGKYDEAVLDVMGLKWNDDKSGVVKK